MTVLSSKDLCHVLICHDHRALYNAFRWIETPQGYSHWYRRWRGTEPFNDDDWAYLIRLANERKGRVPSTR